MINWSCTLAKKSRPLHPGCLDRSEQVVTAFNLRPSAKSADGSFANGLQIGRLLPGAGLQHRLDATEEVEDARHPQPVEDLIAPLVVEHNPRLLQHGEVLGNGGDVGADH